MANEQRTFTQEEVDHIVSERLKREKCTLESFKAQMAAEAAAQAEAEAMKGRFAAVLGNEREVIHPRLTDLMIQDFTQAVKDPQNAGKDDEKIFSELFLDQGYFKPKGAKLFSGSGALPRPENVQASDAISKAFGLTKKG